MTVAAVADNDASDAALERDLDLSRFSALALSTGPQYTPPTYRSP